MAFERELSTARELAWVAGELALRYFHEGVEVEDKADESPVTRADRECESLLSAALERAFPDDGLMGEEGARKSSENGRTWIIDPIDGTRDFVRKYRMWANLLALEVDGVVEVGVVTFPAIQNQYFARSGGGAWRSAAGVETQMMCSTIASAGRAVACVDELNRALTWPNSEKVLTFLSRFWAVRDLGGAMNAMLVCSGSADLWLVPKAMPWDLAPLRVMAGESGVTYFDYTGTDTIYGGNAALCAPGMEREVRDFLGI